MARAASAASRSAKSTRRRSDCIAVRPCCWPSTAAGVGRECNSRPNARVGAAVALPPPMRNWGTWSRRSPGTDAVRPPVSVIVKPNPPSVPAEKAARPPGEGKSSPDSTTAAARKAGFVRLADVTLAWQTDGSFCGVAALDLEPGGIEECLLRLPDGYELVQASVEGVIVSPLPMGEAGPCLPSPCGRGAGRFLSSPGRGAGGEGVASSAGVAAPAAAHRGDLSRRGAQDEHGRPPSFRGANARGLADPKDALDCLPAGVVDGRRAARRRNCRYRASGDAAIEDCGCGNQIGLCRLDRWSSRSPAAHGRQGTRPGAIRIRSRCDVPCARRSASQARSAPPAIDRRRGLRGAGLDGPYRPAAATTLTAASASRRPASPTDQWPAGPAWPAPAQRLPRRYRRFPCSTAPH